MNGISKAWFGLCGELNRSISLTHMNLKLVYARQFHLHNILDYTVWVGIRGNEGKEKPDNGGFVLQAGGKKTVQVEDNWAGRFWARTGCKFDDSGLAHCVTGDCGNELHCNGLEGQPPASLAEVSLQAIDDLDYYSISLADGFNVPIQLPLMVMDFDQLKSSTESYPVFVHVGLRENPGKNLN
ncbi:hypothetical protein ANN_12741 [Periplaneta americana]|uniref:Uncharacterized protein n=1 Tax=Periplaneta americana TaxID=6978 RepID=A0ABQ8TK54_PERAM|nr:hypothetical protein ANN_12741 [Periplaneta americana]